MRKIATLALAAALSIAALAPAAFAKPANCSGKDFAASMKVAAHDKSLKGSEKNAWASLDCVGTVDEPVIPDGCVMGQWGLYCPET